MNVGITAIPVFLTGMALREASAGHFLAHIGVPGEAVPLVSLAFFVVVGRTSLSEAPRL